jgi:hypothetical protein
MHFISALIENAPLVINSLNKILPEEKGKEPGLTRENSHNLRVTCASMCYSKTQ